MDHLSFDIHTVISSYIDSDTYKKIVKSCKTLHEYYKVDEIMNIVKSDGIIMIYNIETVTENIKSSHIEIEFRIIDESEPFYKYLIVRKDVNSIIETQVQMMDEFHNLLHIMKPLYATKKNTNKLKKFIY
jgi:hypothetical protein